jgi:hypothetical protein
MELSEYQLRDANERAALQRLRPVWGGRKHHRDFQKLVLAYLALIVEKYSVSVKPKSVRNAQKLRRHAT